MIFSYVSFNDKFFKTYIYGKEETMQEKKKEIHGKLDALFSGHYDFWMGWHNIYRHKFEDKIVSAIKGGLRRFLRAVRVNFMLIIHCLYIDRFLYWAVKYSDLILRNFPILGQLYSWAKKRVIKLIKSGWFGSITAKFFGTILVCLFAGISYGHITGKPINLAGVQNFSASSEKSILTLFVTKYSIDCLVGVKGNKQKPKHLALYFLGKFTEIEFYERIMPSSNLDADVHCTFGRKYWVVPTSCCEIYVNSYENIPQLFKLQGVDMEDLMRTHIKKWKRGEK